MTPKTLKVENGTITLPKELRQAWRDADVFVMPSKDSLYFKRIDKPSLDKLEKKLKKVGRLITDKDIDEAVKWARKKVY